MTLRKPLSVLVVDDEPLARRRLLRLLREIERPIEAQEAADGLQAFDVLTTETFDVILLDIHMPQLDGLSLAAQEGLPPIIFTTAYSEHAVRAFELGALDYLLKPIHPERLDKALSRVLPSTSKPLEASEAERLKAAPAIFRLKARFQNTVQLVDPAVARRIRAEDKYAVLSLNDEELILDESLNTLQGWLGPRGFMRIHRAELVNLAFIESYETNRGQLTVRLDTGERLKVSRRAAAELKKRLS